MTIPPATTSTIDERAASFSSVIGGSGESSGIPARSERTSGSGSDRSSIDLNLGSRTIASTGKINPTTTKTGRSPSHEISPGAASEPSPPIAMPNVYSTPKTRPSAIDTETLYECEAGNVEGRVAEADHQQGSDSDDGVRQEADHGNRESPQHESESERLGQPATPRQRHGVHGSDDPTDPHRRRQPADTAAAQVDQVERDRDEQNSEHAANEDLGDEAANEDGHVDVVTQLHQSAHQRISRAVACPTHRL